MRASGRAVLARLLLLPLLLASASADLDAYIGSLGASSACAACTLVGTTLDGARMPARGEEPPWLTPHGALSPPHGDVPPWLRTLAVKGWKRWKAPERASELARLLRPWCSTLDDAAARQLCELLVDERSADIVAQVGVWMGDTTWCPPCPYDVYAPAKNKEHWKRLVDFRLMEGGELCSGGVLNLTSCGSQARRLADEL